MKATSIQTNIFRTLIKALHYYRPYGYNLADVMEKVKQNEIVINEKPKSQGYWNSEGRWVEFNKK